MNRILLLIPFLLLLAPALTVADEWPAAAKSQMEAAGARLKAATTTEERVQALREIEQVAAAHPDAPQAQLMARLLAEKATQEAGPAKMLDALGELAASGQITDTETLGSIAVPLLESIAEMRDNGTLLPEAAIQLDNAIKKIDDAAAKAGLPKLSEAIDQATGDTGMAGRLTDTLGKVAALAKAARESADLAKMNEDAKKAYIDNLVSILPPGGGPAINGPAFVVFRDTLVWNSEMFGESSKALDLVSEAIETGQFNHEAYAGIEKRLNELSKGPWNSGTASDFFENLCKKIPVAGAWCGDVFKLAKKLFEEADCDSVTCDCENVSGGLMRGPLIVQCKIQEADLISACKQEKKIVGSCGDASGPAANPK